VKGITARSAYFRVVFLAVAVFAMVFAVVVFAGFFAAVVFTLVFVEVPFAAFPVSTAALTTSDRVAPVGMKSGNSGCVSMKKGQLVRATG